MYSKFAFFILSIDFMLIEAVGWLIEKVIDIGPLDEDTKEAIFLCVIGIICLIIGIGVVT